MTGFMHLAMIVWRDCNEIAEGRAGYYSDASCCIGMAEVQALVLTLSIMYDMI